MSFTSSFSIQGLNVVTGVILARGLGVHGRGELAAVVLWPSVFATVGALGIPEALTYHASRRLAAVGRLVATSTGLLVLQTIGIGAIGGALLPLIFRAYPHAVLVDAYLFLLHAPLWLLYTYLIATLNGLHKFFWFHFLRWLPIAVTGAGLCGLVLDHALSVRSAVVVYLVADAVALVLSSALVLHYRKSALGVSRRAAGSLLRFGIRSHAGTVSSMLNEQLGLLLISVILGASKLGLYAIAVTLSSLTTLVGTSVGMVVLPSVASLDASWERLAAVRRFVGLTLVLALTASVPVLVFTPQLIRLFFGSDFVPAANVARVLVVAMAILSTNRTLGGVVRAVNRPLDAGIAAFLALIVLISGFAVLLPTLGLEGAALASLLAYSISMFVIARRAARALECRVSELLLPGYALQQLIREVRVGAR